MCSSKFASVARGYLLSNLRILRTFLQVCTQHAYRPIHVVFAIYSRARAIGFVLGLMCWEAIGACVHRCIPYAMEQLCTQDTGTGANIVHMGMVGEEVILVVM